MTTAADKLLAIVHDKERRALKALIKVYGDDFNAMIRTAEQVAEKLRAVEGAEDVRVEQVQGLPLLDVRLDRDAMAEPGRRKLRLNLIPPLPRAHAVSRVRVAALGLDHGEVPEDVAE